MATMRTLPPDAIRFMRGGVELERWRCVNLDLVCRCGNQLLGRVRMEHAPDDWGWMLPPTDTPANVIGVERVSELRGRLEYDGAGKEAYEAFCDGRASHWGPHSSASLIELVAVDAALSAFAGTMNGRMEYSYDTRYETTTADFSIERRWVEAVGQAGNTAMGVVAGMPTQRKEEHDVSEA